MRLLKARLKLVKHLAQVLAQLCPRLAPKPRFNLANN
jgi:hypothetical protein